MAKPTQTQRNFALQKVKTEVTKTIAAIQLADVEAYDEAKLQNSPTYGQLQNDLRNGQITLLAGIDLTLPVENSKAIEAAFSAWLIANSLKVVMTNVPIGQLLDKTNFDYGYDRNALRKGLIIKHDNHNWFHLSNFEKVSQLLAAYRATEQEIMLGDSLEMNQALKDFAERMAAIV